MAERAEIGLVRASSQRLHKFTKPTESLALGYLASSLRAAGHSVQLFDGMLMGWSSEEMARLLLGARLDVVGFTVVFQYFPEEISEVSRLLREGGFRGPILVGGHSVSFYPDRILREVPWIDAIVCGEGETAICQAAVAAAAGRDLREVPGIVLRSGDSYHRSPITRVAALDTLPNPARDLVPEIISRDGNVCISTSRGCNSRCSFCSVPRFFGLESGRKLKSGAWLSRNVAHIVDEIVRLHTEYSVMELLIVDDEFFGGVAHGFERGLEFGAALEALNLPIRFALSCRAENVRADVLEQLQRGGLAHVFIGLENGDAAALKLYAKGNTPVDNKKAVETVKSLGLSFQPGFMLFNYNSTLASLRENLEFLREIGECKPVVINSAVDPHFGTPLIIDMERQGVLSDHGLSLSVEFKDPAVRTAKAVAELCAASFEAFQVTIARLQSAVTFEWRRDVPGRSSETKRWISSFENSLNAGYSKLVLEAVEALDSASPPSAGELLEDTSRKIAALEKHFTIAKGLLYQHLSTVAAEIKYVSQADLIRQLPV